MVTTVGYSEKPGVGVMAFVKGAPWLTDPRTAVLVVLGAAALIGGGRKVYNGWRGRRAVLRLEEAFLTPELVRNVVPFGRMGITALFRLLTDPAQPSTIRDAAGVAIAQLWGRDELVAEEEQALVRRAYQVSWDARRRYPRDLPIPIPITVRYGLPFLDNAENPPPGVQADQLAWSHRIVGSRSVTWETFSPFRPGQGHCQLTVNPEDFSGAGPHRLALHARVRTHGLTGDWTLEPPMMPWTLELDPHLNRNALLTLPDEIRADAFADALQLCPATEATATPDAAPSLSILPYNDQWAFHPAPAVRRPATLPCDLAHRIILEIDGVGERPAGSLIVLSQPRPHEPTPTPHPLVFSAGFAGPDLPGVGPLNIRARFEVDPDLSWTHPDVRSVWPLTLFTPWVQWERIRL